MVFIDYIKKITHQNHANPVLTAEPLSSTQIENFWAKWQKDIQAQALKGCSYLEILNEPEGFSHPELDSYADLQVQVESWRRIKAFVEAQGFTFYKPRQYDYEFSWAGISWAEEAKGEQA